MPDVAHPEGCVYVGGLRPAANGVCTVVPPAEK